MIARCSDGEGVHCEDGDVLPLFELRANGGLSAIMDAVEKLPDAKCDHGAKGEA
jgi:hypothetical protein